MAGYNSDDYADENACEMRSTGVIEQLYGINQASTYARKRSKLV